MFRAISLRRLRSDDLLKARQLSASVGWPHRIEDWRFAADTGEAYVAVCLGEVVGTAVIWRFGENSASIGLVTSSPALRAYKVEQRLIERVIELTQESTIVLNAPIAKITDYEQLQFSHHLGSVEQYQGAANDVPEVFPNAGVRLRPLCRSDTPRLTQLATQASGLDRSGLMPRLLGTATGIGLERDGVLMGFALFRRFGRGFTVGPVVTAVPDDVSSSMCLISYLLRRNSGKLVRIDIPKGTELARCVRKLGLEHVDTVLKMSRNGVLLVDQDVRQTALTSHSLC